ncbi:MAG: M13-type metalloendopeptidase [Pseudomonadota bacterium]
MNLALASGIEMDNVDPSVRAQDDFYAHVNGRWLARTRLPAGRASWSAFDEVGSRVETQLQAIVADCAGDAEAEKIAALHASFLDMQARQRRGPQALACEVRRVAALSGHDALPALIARFNRLGLNAPYALAVCADARDAARQRLVLRQAGLGLPDRRYYDRTDACGAGPLRRAYQAHIETMFALQGWPDGRAAAAAIVAFESALAAHQWGRADCADPRKCDNRFDKAGLRALAPDYGWDAYLCQAGVAGIDALIVAQPDYLCAFARLARATPVATWRHYLVWHLLDGCAPYLGQEVVAEDFAFHGTLLRGIPAAAPPWQGALRVVEQCLGDALGKRYAARCFPDAHRVRLEALVGNVMAACRAGIDTLEWMGAATRQQARCKLDALTCKIGAPSRWRDYAALHIAPDALLENVLRARLFRSQCEIDQLGRPTNRAQWSMTPQTVNARYDPALNEIVFPAAILQPPFFNAGADDACNYGAIGAIIGHEICHGFDLVGSHYDAAGNLRDWWGAGERARFAGQGAALVAQYGTYCPLPGQCVDGQLTLGENFADNAGLAAAYGAYRRTLAGGHAPLIDGLTGDQRFYMGFAQAWRHVACDRQTLLALQTDSHAPPRFRVLGCIQNQGAFFQAFGVGEGDAMYAPPARRVTVWHASPEQVCPWASAA